MKKRKRESRSRPLQARPASAGRPTGRGVEAPSPTRERQGWRRRWGAAVLLGAAGLGWLLWREAWPAPQPVAPADLEAVDPEIRPLLERELAQAAREPRSAQSHGNLGLLYEANEMWPEAERSFALAARLQAREPLWRLHRALALREIGDFDAALALLRALAGEERQLAAAHYHLGDALLEAGLLDEALEGLERAARLAPTSPETHARLGAALLRRRDPAAAASHLERALELDAGYGSAHHLLGLAYRGLGREEDAARELALGQGAEPRRIPDALSGRLAGFRVDYASQVDRSVGLLRAGKEAEAIRILEGLRGRRPDDMVVVNNLAIAYKKRGQVQRAMELLEQAKARAPEVFSTWLNLASCLLETGQLEAALGHAERAAALAPEVGKTHLLVGQVLMRQGRADAAYRALKLSVGLDARDPDAHVLLGEVAFALGRPEEARASFETALRIAPDHLGAHVDLGRVLAELGRFDEAERELDAARKLAPGERLVEMLSRLIADRRAGR